MFTIKLHEFGPKGLMCAVLRTAESIEIIADGDDYIIDTYIGGSVDGRITLKGDRVASVFIENALGKTVQRLDSACSHHPRP